MTMEEIKQFIVAGIAKLKFEGDFDTVKSATDNIYIKIGIGGWESYKADMLLEIIDSKGLFDDRSYSDIHNSKDLLKLQKLLSSDIGKRAQLDLLKTDVDLYVRSLLYHGVHDDEVLIYTGLWATTSIHRVCQFIENMKQRIKITNLENVHQWFKEKYITDHTNAQLVESIQQRADDTYDYVMSMY